MTAQFRHYASMSSVLTRPDNTTAYSQNDLIASSTTAANVVVPYFSFTDDDAEMVEVQNARLFSNITSGFTTFQGHIDLWTSAPTFTNGDNGAYAVATGAAGWVGHLTTSVSDAYSVAGDGAFIGAIQGTDATNNYATEKYIFARKPGDWLYWSLREIDSTGFTPIALQTFTLVLSVKLFRP